MRETRTINEWMDQVTTWQNICERSTPDIACTTCIGAIHPVLAATARHLEQFIVNKDRTIGTGNALRLAMETDGMFEEIQEKIRHLVDTEQASPTKQAADDEQLDIGIIVSDMRQLLSVFERIIPDIGSHTIATGVRHIATDIS